MTTTSFLSRFKPTFAACATLAALLAVGAVSHTHAGPLDAAGRAWTYNHSNAAGFLSEIPAYDSATGTLWIAGASGVDVVNARTGVLIQRLNTTAYGGLNSVAIYNGVAAMSFESTVRTNPGTVALFSTSTRAPLSGVNTITVGALPDMLTFTPDGSRLLVANEATPSIYGALTSAPGVFPRSYGPAALDPVGSVSIINMATRSVSHTATFAGVATSGSMLRTNTGMDFEPEYIAVNAAGTKAYVSLQEANGMAVLNLLTGSFEQVIGLGFKDFSLPGNRIDPRNNGTIELVNVALKGLYQPDALATFERGGKTFIVMANEGDFREDDGDRSTASVAGLNTIGLLANLRVSNTDSSAGNLFVAGSRSFSIRDEQGALVYDSGEILDREAILAGIYDDGRSRDKGVEPEGVELIEIAGRMFAFVGLERTLQSSIAVFDITDPADSKFIRLLLGANGERAPEGLKGFAMDGIAYLAVSSEVSNTTTLFALGSTVSEPASLGLVMTALGGALLLSRRRRG